MKNAIIWIAAAIFLLAVSQPLLEMFNLFTEKITLSSAILNSCRAASNNALMYDSLSTVDAVLSESAFKEEFARAFSATLDVDIIDDIGNPVRFAANDRWGAISVSINFGYIESYDFDERYISQAEISLTMPYIFKTGLLSRLISDANVYEVTENRVFLIQIIN